VPEGLEIQLHSVDPLVAATTSLCCNDLRIALAHLAWTALIRETAMEPCRVTIRKKTYARAVDAHFDRSTCIAP
jgi:hypothetical protein